MKFSNLIINFPVISYFVLTFAVSWSGIIVISFFTGMPAPGKVFESIAPVAMLPLVLGPAIVALLFTGIIYGKKGIKILWLRIIKFKISIKFYLFALLLFPILASVALFILSSFSSDFLPKIITAENKSELIITGLSIGIILTLFEEIGWQGFALPELRKKFTVFQSGLLLGFLWGAWHFLPVLYGCGDESGRFNLQLFYPGLFFHYAGLIPFRIAMVWLYEKTESLLLGWIMHASLTSCAFFILNINNSGFTLFVYYLALAIGLWAAVSAVFIKKSR